MSLAAKDGDRAGALIRRLRLNGPVTLAEFMNLALIGKDDGYYAQGQPIGAAGDFITAPEISQMFGELLGLWCVDVWTRLGEPDPFLLVEFGPGRATLMADLLRAASRRKRFQGAMRLHLVEVSRPLMALQQERIGSFRPQWHRDAANLPEGPMIAIGNEFLDVFPIHQFVMTERGWRERAVGLVGEGLGWVLVPPGPALALLGAVQHAAKPGDIAEVSPSALGFMGEIARRLAAHPGAALFIDYGRAESGLGGSVQAVRRHRAVDPLAHFGAADLTAHVDFGALRRCAVEAGASVSGPVEQGAFLTALGLPERARRLAETASAEDLTAIESAQHRLLDADQMGALFKAMAVATPGLGPLAGF